MHFSRYGVADLAPIDYDDLLHHQQALGDLVARAENSGSEGCVTEVARWNPRTKRYERYCFRKWFAGDPQANGRHDPSVPSYVVAASYADIINDEGDAALSPLIHRFPDWVAEPPEPVTLAIKPGWPGSFGNKSLRWRLVGFVGTQYLEIPFETPASATDYAQAHGWLVQEDR